MQDSGHLISTLWHGYFYFSKTFHQSTFRDFSKLVTTGFYRVVFILSPAAENYAAVSFIHQSKVVCGYPLSIFFIVVNEFCERFSYYGMRGENILF